MPFLPDDFDTRYFQAAADDQQVPYPQGGEPIEIVNSLGRGASSPPAQDWRSSSSSSARSGRITQKIANLDTILFLPGQPALVT